MSHQGRFSLLLTGMLISLFISSSYAVTNPSWYKIELLIFQHKGKIDEQGQNVVPLTPPKRAIYLNNHLTTTNQHWSLLPAEESFKQAAYRIAKQSSRYQILFQSAWLQDNLQKRPIVIKTGKDLAPIAIAKKEIIVLRGPLWQLEGSLRINKKRTFNTHLFFAFRLITPQEQLVEYDINEYRSLKLNKIHYFDNPAFGILMRISKAEQPIDPVESNQINNSGSVTFRGNSMEAP